MSRATIVVIRPNNTIADPGPIRCNPGDRIALVIVNDDDKTHTMWVAPDGIVFKANRKPHNPLSLTSRRVRVNAGVIKVLTQRVRAATGFVRGVAAAAHRAKMPYGRYKYTISWGDGAGRHVKTLDPDLEVSPPGN